MFLTYFFPNIYCCRHVAGGAGVSVQQPTWGPDGKLYFISDESGWWNLYCQDTTGQVCDDEPVEVW